MNGEAVTDVTPVRRGRSWEPDVALTVKHKEPWMHPEQFGALARQRIGELLDDAERRRLRRLAKPARRRRHD